jgi:hypothetical protein
MKIYLIFEKEKIVKNLSKIINFFGAYENKQDAENQKKIIIENRIKDNNIIYDRISRTRSEILEDYKKSIEEKYFFEIDEYELL